jgi:SpoVK/Ycf46/Vps4 family AAA+-type ATPase
MGFSFSVGNHGYRGPKLAKKLLKHFAVSAREIATAGRQFPITARIDQAIEFPLPDGEGRAKLTKLYARGLQIPDDLLDLIVRRTKGVSGAFIKELMRRCAQFQIETSGGKLLAQASVDAALEEMLFAGGALNRRLLGGEEADPSPA